MLRICPSAHMVDSVVYHLFTVYFRTFLCPFCVVANCVVVNFVSCSSDSSCGPLVIIKSIHGQVRRGGFPGSPSGYLDWGEAFELVADRPIPDCMVSDARSDDVMFSTRLSRIVTVTVVHARMRYGPSFRRSNFEYKLVAVQSAAVISNGERSA